jgi:hypothetical protein
MKTLCFTLFLTSFLSAASLAAGILPSIQKGEAYALAREKMLNSGFIPYRSSGSDPCDVTDPRCFPETQTCSGTGAGFCIQLWEKTEKIFEIQTAGDTPVVDRVLLCKDETFCTGKNLVKDKKLFDDLK